MNNLKSQRKEMGMTQQQVADLIGCSRETYIRYESRNDMPSLVDADKLARLFCVTMYDLWPELLSSIDYNYSMKRNFLEGRDDALAAMITL